MVRHSSANGGGVGVILTPRADNTAMISVASWARLLNLDVLDLALIRSFVETNRGKAQKVSSHRSQVRSLRCEGRDATKVCLRVCGCYALSFRDNTPGDARRRDGQLLAPFRHPFPTDRAYAAALTQTSLV